MDKLFTTSNIMFALGIIGLLFTIWEKVTNPQIRLDKKQAVDKSEEEGKARILEQRVQWSKEDNDRRFNEMGTRLTEAMTLAQNHTHTVDVKVDKLIESVNLLAIGVGKLETVIDERIPKKIQ